jgi:large exoprotein involved in heme utilization and adhesion
MSGGRPGAMCLRSPGECWGRLQSSGSSPVESEALARGDRADVLGCEAYCAALGLLGFLATRGNDAYVTIAHANEISLVRNDNILKVTGSGTQNAPCWVALDGPFLFSANSPSRSVSRYAVYGQQIIQDAAIVATFNGNPTDIAYRSGFAAVVDADGTASHVSVFGVGEDGKFTLKGLATTSTVATNGIAIVRSDERIDY